MACNRPLRGYVSRSGGITSKRTLAAFPVKLMTVPCGKCLGCQIDYSRDWAVRCAHEARSHVTNCIVTLTYSKRNLPPNGELLKVDLQQFFKRLREVKSFRYFAVGEYGAGGPGYHPHFHVVLFGCDFEDRYPWSKTKAGSLQYRSPLLESRWRLGYSTVGEFSWSGAAYCARYVTKKIYGDKADDHYSGLQPEFLVMSKGRKDPGQDVPGTGLGAKWFIENHTDVFPDDFIRLNGKNYPVPRYYDKLYERMYPEAMEVIRQRRKETAEATQRRYDAINNNKIRQEDKREMCLALRTRKLERNYEDGSQGF